MSMNLGGDQCAFKYVRFIDINPRHALRMEGFKRKDTARVLQSHRETFSLGRIGTLVTFQFGYFTKHRANE